MADCFIRAVARRGGDENLQEGIKRAEADKWRDHPIALNRDDGDILCQYRRILPHMSEIAQAIPGMALFIDDGHYGSISEARPEMARDTRAEGT